MAKSVHYVTLFIALTTLPLWYAHYERYTVNVAQLLLSLFCSINTLICLWELSLYYHRKLIKAEFMQLQKQVPQGTLPPMFLFQEVKLKQALTLQHWSKVWSTYSLMDPSYSDPFSFGFWVDVGNGHVTLPPTVLFMLCMTWDLLPARVVGSICLVAFWQMLYGTILYFCTYFHNERWRGRPGLPLVLASNVIWVLGPAWGMAVSWQFIQQGNYSVVRA